MAAVYTSQSKAASRLHYRAHPIPDSFGATNEPVATAVDRLRRRLKSLLAGLSRE
ncbi:hypothetical protein [Phormidesmis priestleyi]|uniref:hypothetical protein n=1 Tax=Phormidesmis priestleyi TaxID=268141 RepID=UPI000B2F17B0|nr:hypothetical protein [Phormidesmis priestleyi]